MADKKAMLGTIVGLIIFLLVIFLTFNMCSTIFGKSTGEQQYNNLVNTLVEVSDYDEGTSRNVNLKLPEDTAIFGFYKNSKEINIRLDYKSFGGCTDMVAGFKIKRPSQCTDNTACLCYCGKETFTFSDGSDGVSSDIAQIGCGVISCTDLEKVGFKNFDSGLTDSMFNIDRWEPSGVRDDYYETKTRGIVDKAIFGLKVAGRTVVGGFKIGYRAVKSVFTNETPKEVCIQKVYRKESMAGGFFINHWGYYEDPIVMVRVMKTDRYGETVLLCDHDPCNY